MDKIVKINKAWDKRHSNPSKNYGIHGCDMRFVLKGKHGAIQFVIYTNWHLPDVQQELINKTTKNPSKTAIETLLPLPADFGYHSKKPQYEGQDSMGACEYCDGQDCYYDGSGLFAEEVYNKMLLEGDSAVWEELEKSYIDRFGELK